MRLFYAILMLVLCVSHKVVAGYSFSIIPTRQPGGDSIPRLNNTAVKMAWSRNYAGSVQLLQRALTGRPVDTLLYNQGLALGRLRRFEEAEQVLRSIQSFHFAQANQGVYRCLTGDCVTGIQLMETATVGRQQADKAAFNKALAYLQVGRHAEALRAAEQAVQLRGSEPVYRMVKGDALLALGKYEDALSTYRSLEKQEKVSRIMPVRTGHALLGLKRFEDAAGKFTEYLESTDRSQQAAAHYGLGSALYGQKEFLKSVVEYRRAVQFEPQSAMNHTGLGNAFCSLRDYKNARIEFETALAQNPEAKHARLGLGVVSYRQGRFEEAISHFSKVEDLFDPKNPELADSFLSRGMARLELNQPELALEDFGVTMSLAKNHPAAYAGVSEAYRRKGSIWYALEFLDKAINRSPQDDKMLTNKGNLYLKAGRIDEAFSNFSYALNHNGRNINALNGFSIALLEKDRIEEAQYLLDSLIGRGNHKAFLYNNRGIVRSYRALKFEKEKDLNQAKQFYYRSMKDFGKARDLDSTHKSYFNNLGNVYKNIREFSNAVRSYQAHLDKSAINNMGVLFASNSKGDLSRHYLNIAVRLDSANIVYHYNRFKVYHQFFRDSLAKRQDLLRMQDLMPTTSISAKYSKDGYINIYLYDYDFEKYEFPGDHYFPIRPDTPLPPEYRPPDDFLMMEIRRAPSKPNVETIRVASRRMPKARKLRNLGSTKCPKII